MFRAIAAIAFLISICGFEAYAQDGVREYNGMCEVSAGVFLDAEHFVVASDETNVLQLYKRNSPDPIKAINLIGPPGFNKSDLEGAARFGDTVYWISSHSFNSSGEDKKKRKVLFATKIVRGGGAPTLESIGAPATDLRDGIANAAGAAANKLNIEGLAATPAGGLLIGLRSPLEEGSAIVVTLINPGEVIAGGKALWGPRHAIDLQGLGVRSMDLIEGDQLQYLIAAG